MDTDRIESLFPKFLQLCLLELVKFNDSTK